MYNTILFVAIITLIFIFLINAVSENLMDRQTYNLLMDLPYVNPVQIRGHNPNEYFGYGYLTPKAGAEAAMGNSLRVLGQEFTNPRQGTAPDIAFQNKYLNKISNQ